MDKKIISKINKVYDLLYDLKYNKDLDDLKINNQMDLIEEFMLIKGYEYKINNKNKCVFIKIKDKK